MKEEFYNSLLSPFFGRQQSDLLSCLNCRLEPQDTGENVKKTLVKSINVPPLEVNITQVLDLYIGIVTNYKEFNVMMTWFESFKDTRPDICIYLYLGSFQ